MMIPSPRLFRSRKAALFWAAGVVWFAVEVAGSAPHSRSQQQGNAADATGETVTAADLSTIANAMAQ